MYDYSTSWLDFGGDPDRDADTEFDLKSFNYCNQSTSQSVSQSVTQPDII